MSKIVSMFPTREEVMEAIQYLWGQGFVDEMTRDKKHYTEILLHAASEKYGIALEVEE